MPAPLAPNSSWCKRRAAFRQIQSCSWGILSDYMECMVIYLMMKTQLPWYGKNIADLVQVDNNESLSETQWVAPFNITLHGPRLSSSGAAWSDRQSWGHMTDDPKWGWSTVDLLFSETDRLSGSFREIAPNSAATIMLVYRLSIPLRWCTALCLIFLFRDDIRGLVCWNNSGHIRRRIDDNISLWEIAADFITASMMFRALE